MRSAYPGKIRLRIGQSCVLPRVELGGGDGVANPPGCEGHVAQSPLEVHVAASAG
jgi:hypothetical protein